MKIVYLGAEVPSNRVILESMGITEFGFSFWRLLQRGLPKTKIYELKNYFQPGSSIHVYPGIPAAAKLDPEQVEDFLADYEDFLAVNMDEIASFTDINHPLVTKGLLDDQRTLAFGEEAKFRPIWTSRYNYAELSELSTKYPSIAVPGELIKADPSISQKIKSLQRQTDVKVHALSYATPDELISGTKWDSVSTMSWLSPMMRGETIVWDGTRIVRYPARMKEQARPRYKMICESAGLDFDKILNDDPVEVAKLAVWSYDQLELRIAVSGNDNIYDNLPAQVSGTNAETTPAVHDMSGGQMRKLQPRNPAEIVNLPVFGVENQTIIEVDDEGRDVIKDVPMLTSNSTSLRQCNTCFVASNCPAFKADSMCAFKLPVEIKTKDQLKSLINAIIEMQGQRVAFARFSEEMNGGYPDPNTSQEIDRLFKLIKTVKELDDSREFIRMTVEKQGGPGVLSNIFGDRAQVLRELPSAEIIDAEQVDNIINRSLEQ